MTETHHPSDIIPGMEGIIHHLTDGNEFKEYVPCKGQGSKGYGFSYVLFGKNGSNPDENGFPEPVLPSSMP